MADILAKIAAYKADEVKALKAQTSRAALDKIIKHLPPTRGFEAALRAEAPYGPALIAEVKKASPSKGLIREDFNPAQIARAYEDGGASCLSVLTDGPGFQGSEAILREVCAVTNLPVIRKDFMIDPIQITESRALGADAILIIMAMVDDKTAKALFAEAARLGLDALVETHNETEMHRARSLGASLIGINNRDLKTFNTSLKTFQRVAKSAPQDALLVAESGIGNSEDILSLTAFGAEAFLVGESLMRQDDVKAATQVLLGKQRK